MKRARALLLLVVGCSRLPSPAPLTMTDYVSHAGYATAAECLGGRVATPYDSIQRVIVPGGAFAVKLGSDSVLQEILPGAGTAIGFADLYGQRVYISELYRDNVRLWAHEYAHVLGMLRDHPDSVYVRCGLK